MLKPHEYRELVNDLRDIALKYHGAGCLRELINRRLGQSVKIEKKNECDRNNQQGS